MKIGNQYLFTKGGMRCHICFFADDLVLFAECSVQQIENIQSCLGRFCQASVEKVSVVKTEIFSQRMSILIWFCKLVQSVAGEKVAFLGKYLGVPILHGWVTKRTYAYLLDNIRKILSGRVVSKLSMARKITLIHSVLTTIPLYGMQTSILSRGIYDEPDRISRNFLWDTPSGEGKIHIWVGMLWLRARIIGA